MTIRNKTAIEIKIDIIEIINNQLIELMNECKENIERDKSILDRLSIETKIRGLELLKIDILDLPTIKRG